MEERHHSLRRASAIVGIVLWVGWMVPPLSSGARHYEFAQALQYAVFTFVAPVLIAVGAPWRAVRWASAALDGTRRGDARIERHNRSSGQRRLIARSAVLVLIAILWRVAPVVDALVRHPLMVVLEALTLTGAALGVFIDLVDSPPLRARTARPMRIGVSAVVMWAVWIVAYLNGMSATSWYTVFAHHPGGLSLPADQQLSAGSIWLFSAASFVPIVFWNLMHWLQSEEDPSDELYRLVRDEKARGFFGTRD